MKREEIISFCSYLQSQKTAQDYLKHCYEKIPAVDAEKKSYENASAFLYYLSHGRRFYENGQKLDLLLQPLLYFYGMVHWLKACLLTERPDYPESTSVLAHGVSARKRKKKHYIFGEDEVRVQHNGLLPYFTRHLFHLKYLPFEKIDMGSLLRLIPELNPLFSWYQQQAPLVHIGSLHEQFLHFPHMLLDRYHLTRKAFANRIKGYFPKNSICSSDTDNSSICFEITAQIDETKSPFYMDSAQNIYFPADRKQCLSLPEVVVHYLILYNLSMLSRYEAEWWGELLVAKSDIDFPLISQFLKVTADKMPLYLGQELHKRFIH